MSSGIRVSYTTFSVVEVEFALLEDKIKAKNTLFEIVKGNVDPIVVRGRDKIDPLLDVVLAAFPQVDEDSIDFQQINKCLTYGVIDEQEESSGYTPLIYAAYNCLPKVVGHLLSKGASANIKEEAGFNAFSIANYCIIRCLKLQIKNGEKKLTKTFTAEMKQQKDYFYAEKMARYQLIVNLLDPHTEDRKFPSSL